MPKTNHSPSEFDWRRPIGLADLGIVCCTRIGRTAMVGESWLVGWQALGSSRIDVASTRYQLKTGDVNFVPPHTAVSLHPLEPGSRYLALLAPPDAVVRAATDLSSGEITSVPAIPPVLRGSKLDNAGLQMYFAITECDEPLRTRTAWLDLMSQILDATVAGATVPEPDPMPVRRARDFLHDHADELISLDQISNAAGVSKYYLVRLFHSTVGMSPYRYHLCVRADRARMLLDGGSTPSQAAAAAGFFDQSHFTRVFKQIFGVTPGMYARAPDRWPQSPPTVAPRLDDGSIQPAERNVP